MYDLVLFGSGNSKYSLTKLHDLGISKIVAARIGKFGDGEVSIEISQNLRGKSVLIVQSLYSDSMILELMLLLDSCMRLGALRASLIIPYMAYSRQDRLFNGAPLSAKVVADMICMNPLVSEIIALDLHNPSTVGFFKVPTTNLYPTKLFAAQCHTEKNICIVAPDFGGITRATMLAQEVNALQSIAFIRKHRASPGISEAVEVIGDVQGKNCIIVDDIIDGGSTLCNAAKLLSECGASSVKAFITHGVLSSNAVERVEKSDLKQVLITDSIVRNTDLQLDYITTEDGISAKTKVAYIPVITLITQTIKMLNGVG